MNRGATFDIHYQCVGTSSYLVVFDWQLPKGLVVNINGGDDVGTDGQRTYLTIEPAADTACLATLFGTSEDISRQNG